MELMEAMSTRRSVRRFKSTRVPKEVIVRLLEAAALAPTAGNRQTWEFLVIEGKHLKRMLDLLDRSWQAKVAELPEETLSKSLEGLSIPTVASGDKVKGLWQFYKTLGGAPVAIVITVPKSEDHWTWSNNIKEGSAATENLILAAWDAGLGSCWMTGPIHKYEDTIKEFLRIEKDKEIIAIVPIGKPDVEPAKPRKIAVETKTRWLS